MADEKKNNYSTQKKYLSSQKQLRVWLSPEKYEALKEKAHAEGTSIYALVNSWVDAYLQETPEA